MAEVLVIGKKISDMDLVTNITGAEKIPTDVVGDKAVSAAQLLEYIDRNGKATWGKVEGDIDEQTDLLNKFTQIGSSISAHINDEDNPHNVTATQVGLGNVDNTSDLDKPVSNAFKELTQKGTTAQRPTTPILGQRYYDTTLLASGKPVEWNGVGWVDSTGAAV